MPSNNWMGLMIGNSRLHWGIFEQEKLIKTWSSEYFSRDRIQNLIQNPILPNFLSPYFSPFAPPHLRTSAPPYLPPSPPPLLLASVVPTQTELWQDYPNLRILTLSDIPLHDLYPTLGIDRALAVFAAGEKFGFPVLVIDGGTALTFTAVDANKCFFGGAILPGLGLQLTTLEQRTGQLPKITPSSQIKSRWATNTTDAIQSGVIYTLLAGIKDYLEDWWRIFPNSKAVLIGGDGKNLYVAMQSVYPQIGTRLLIEENLILEGIGKLKRGI